MLINDSKFDVIGASETRLKKNIRDRELFIDGYEIYRNDRDTAGCGVAMYVRNNLSHYYRDNITDPNVEMLGFQVTPNHARSFIVLCRYRPATSGIDNTTFETLTKILEQIDVEGKEIMLIGDTNCDLKGSKDGNTIKLNLITPSFSLSRKLRSILG